MIGSEEDIVSLQFAPVDPKNAPGLRLAGRPQQQGEDRVGLGVLQNVQACVQPVGLERPACHQVGENRVVHLLGMHHAAQDSVLIDQHSLRPSVHHVGLEGGARAVQPDPAVNRLFGEEGYDGGRRFVADGEELNVREFGDQFIQVGDLRDAVSAPGGPEFEDCRFAFQDGHTGGDGPLQGERGSGVANLQRLSGRYGGEQGKQRKERPHKTPPEIRIPELFICYIQLGK